MKSDTFHTAAATRMPEPEAMPVEAAARLAGIGRTKLYAVIASGELPSIKHGRRRLIRLATLRMWLASMETVTPPRAV